MLTLTEIMNAESSDKGTAFGERHGYTKVYDKWFSLVRYRPINILEIGVCDPRKPGASLMGWYKYFDGWPNPGYNNFGSARVAISNYDFQPWIRPDGSAYYRPTLETCVGLNLPVAWDTIGLHFVEGAMQHGYRWNVLYADGRVRPYYNKSHHGYTGTPDASVVGPPGANISGMSFVTMITNNLNQQRLPGMAMKYRFILNH